MTKVKWKVSEAPTGRYRSFERRMWPTGDIDGKAAFYIACEDSYVPANVKCGNHAELRLSVARYDEQKIGFTWFTFNKRFATLQEAKDFAQVFADKNPYFFENKVDRRLHVA